jgi:hypothetical protein
MQDSVQSGFERLGAPGDCCKRVIDFVRHTGGQKTDASELLVSDHLLGALTDLLFKVLLNRQETLCTEIDRVGQFGDFIRARGVDPIGEIAIRYPSRTVQEVLKWSNHG